LARRQSGALKTPWDKLIRDCKRAMVNKTYFQRASIPWAISTESP